MTSILNGGVRLPTLPKKEALSKQGRAKTNYESALKELTSNQKSDQAAFNLFDSAAGQAALNKLRQERSGDAQAVINMARDASQGLTAGQGRAFQNQAVSEMQAAQRASLARLGGQQAALGIQGPASVGQRAALMGQQNAQLGQFNTELLAQKIAARNAGIQTFGQAVTNQENIERDMAADKLGTALAFRQNRAVLKGAELQAKAARQGGGKGGGK